MLTAGNALGKVAEGSGGTTGALQATLRTLAFTLSDMGSHGCF